MIVRSLSFPRKGPRRHKSQKPSDTTYKRRAHTSDQILVDNAMPSKFFFVKGVDFSDINVLRVKPPENPPRRFEVSVPEWFEEANSCIKYEVKTTSNSSKFKSRDHTIVIRSFECFEWLHNMMSACFPGAIIPHLPSKKLHEKRPLLEECRKGLEKFLTRITFHAELSTSDHFLAFLKLDDERMREHQSSSGNTAGILKNFRTSFAKAQNFFKMPLDIWLESPLEMKFEQLEKELDILEANLTDIATWAIRLNQRVCDIEHLITPDQDGKDSAAVRFMVKGIEMISNEMPEYIRTREQKIEDMMIVPSIQEYLLMLREVQKSLKSREEKKVAFLTTFGQLKSIQMYYKYLKKQTGTAFKQKHNITKVREQRDEAILDAHEARGILEIVSARVLREMGSFAAVREECMRNIALDYVNAQISYSKLIGERWEKILPSFDFGLEQELLKVADTQPSLVDFPQKIQSTGNMLDEENNNASALNADGLERSFDDQVQVVMEGNALPAEDVPRPNTTQNKSQNTAELQKGDLASSVEGDSNADKQSSELSLTTAEPLTLKVNAHIISNVDAVEPSIEDAEGTAEGTDNNSEVHGECEPMPNTFGSIETKIGGSTKLLSKKDEALPGKEIKNICIETVDPNSEPRKESNFSTLNAINPEPTSGANAEINLEGDVLEAEDVQGFKYPRERNKSKNTKQKKKKRNRKKKQSGANQEK